MPELIKLGVLYWIRFVDDTFVVIKSREQAENILEFLNNQHKTIKFTMEKELNGSINFLDVKITRNSDNTISTSTYRKPTFTGVMLNWNSLTSIKYKLGLIYCLFTSHSIRMPTGEPANRSVIYESWISSSLRPGLIC